MSSKKGNDLFMFRAYHEKMSKRVYFSKIGPGKANRKKLEHHVLRIMQDIRKKMDPELLRFAQKTAQASMGNASRGAAEVSSEAASDVSSSSSASSQGSSQALRDSSLAPSSSAPSGQSRSSYSSEQKTSPSSAKNQDKIVSKGAVPSGKGAAPSSQGAVSSNQGAVPYDKDRAREAVACFLASQKNNPELCSKIIGMLQAD